jgi:hypothetical protein
MAVRTHPYKIYTVPVQLVKQRVERVELPKPRRCMVVSVGMILAGLSIPLLMAIELLPVTLFLGFVGFALAAAGGLLALIFCGEF